MIIEYSKWNLTIPAEKMIMKTIPTIKATERHPIITIKTIFHVLTFFLDSALVKKGSIFADGIFLNFKILFSFF